LFSEELERQVAERTLSLHEANVELRHSNKIWNNLPISPRMTCRSRSGKSELIRLFCKAGIKMIWPDGVKEMLIKIETSAERMSNLIKEVLNFSKILHHGGDAFEKSDLNIIINEVLHDF